MFTRFTPTTRTLRGSTVSRVRTLTRVAASVAALALVTGAIELLKGHVPVLSLAVLYLLAIIPVAVAWGIVYAVGMAIASMLAFNFFFLPPLYTLTIQDSRNWFALLVFLVTAVVVSELATRSRRRAEEAEQALAALQRLTEERERLAEEVLEAEALRRSDALKTALLRAVSHDLRSPLTAILASADALASPGLTLEPEDRLGLAETIRGEATRLDRVVEQLLDLSRLEAGAAEPHRELWHADELVGQALAGLGTEAGRVRLAGPAPGRTRRDRAPHPCHRHGRRAARRAAGGSVPAVSARDGRTRVRAWPGDRARVRRGERRPALGAGRSRRRAPRPLAPTRGAPGSGARLSARVLVVDDEPQILRALRTSLHGAGYEVETAETAEGALAALAANPPDAVVLDLVLPDGSGTAVCRELRTWSSAPVIVLSVVGDEAEKVAALDAGADDYVTKPFGIDELLARLRAALRRADAPAEPVVELGDLRIDLEKRAVSVRGEAVQLTPHEFALLRVLARNPGKLLTHAALLREVWGRGYGDESHYLHVYVSQLRRKLEADPARPRYILTEPGAGYRLAP